MLRARRDIGVEELQGAEADCGQQHHLGELEQGDKPEAALLPSSLTERPGAAMPVAAWCSRWEDRGDTVLISMNRAHDLGIQGRARKPGYLREPRPTEGLERRLRNAEAPRHNLQGHGGGQQPQDQLEVGHASTIADSAGLGLKEAAPQTGGWRLGATYPIGGAEKCNREEPRCGSFIQRTPSNAGG